MLPVPVLNILHVYTLVVHVEVQLAAARVLSAGTRFSILLLLSVNFSRIVKSIKLNSRIF